MRSTCEATADYALALGDDALIASQRLAEWVTRAPQLEEDVALANIALDLLGQARALLAHAGALQDPPRSSDELAYERDAAGFRNAVLVERENGDFAATMVRLLLFSAYAGELYGALRGCAEETLVAVAAKAVPEVAYHRDHARHWVIRLGDGTAESRRRTEQALAAEWPWFGGLFEPVTPDDPVDHTGFARPACSWVADVLAEAGLAVPVLVRADLDGRRGDHTDALALLLEELQSVARVHPGAIW